MSRTFPTLMIDPKPNLTPREAGFKPYPLDRITQHAAAGIRMLDGKYPTVTGLEHDELGHPTGSPRLHMAMTAKRREKIKHSPHNYPQPEVYGERRCRDAPRRLGLHLGPDPRSASIARGPGVKAASLHIRHLHPLPNGLEEIFERFQRIVVVEMNDEGIYGSASSP